MLAAVSPPSSSSPDASSSPPEVSSVGAGSDSLDEELELPPPPHAATVSETNRQTTNRPNSRPRWSVKGTPPRLCAGGAGRFPRPSTLFISRRWGVDQIEILACPP